MFDPAHPLDGTPLTARPWHVLGHRADGRPIHPIAGGAPDGDGGGSGSSGSDGGSGSSSGSDGGSGSSSGGSNSDSGGTSGGGSGSSSGSDSGSGSGAGTKDAQRVEDLPEWAQKIVRDARTDAGNARTAKNTAEQNQTKMLDDIAKALGLKKDEAPDPAKLAEQLSSAKVGQRQAQVELAVYRGAAKHQADPAALLDSRAFMASVADLDPSAKDFADKIGTAIKDAVKDNQKLKAGQASTSSSVDHSGGTGERRSAQPKSLADAVGGHYGT